MARRHGAAYARIARGRALRLGKAAGPQERVERLLAALEVDQA